ncbi:DUF6415 family natural product biosynthesis protein [Streptomyces sp. M41]|uniref:DUF6415 family natural product biosynthesis protein n=1 Tax=Streptomyces sp. M41 TaxID=3059412 RepID=UPI00374DB38F
MGVPLHASARRIAYRMPSSSRRACGESPESSHIIGGRSRRARRAADCARSKSVPSGERHPGTDGLPRARHGEHASRSPWFLDQRALPRHESLKLWSTDLSTFLEHLASEIQQLAASLPVSDVPGRLAIAGVGEARRRLDEPEAAGLHGETERVKRPARSVPALCDHRAALTGARMCLACDQPLDDGRPTQPYEQVSPSGGAQVSGRSHAACSSAGRPRR